MVGRLVSEKQERGRRRNEIKDDNILCLNNSKGLYLKLEIDCTHIDSFYFAIFFVWNVKYKKNLKANKFAFKKLFLIHHLIINWWGWWVWNWFC